MLPLSRSMSLITLPRGGAAAASWWLSGGISPANCVAAYQPKGAADLAASYANLAVGGAAYDLTLGVAPTWDAVNGWIFDGTTQYLKTGITPSDGWSALIRYNTLTYKNYATLFGGKTNLGKFFGVTLQLAANKYYLYLNNYYKLIYAVMPTSGVIGIAGQQGYLNGLADGTTITTTTGTYAEVYIGVNNDPTKYYAQVHVQAFVIWNTIITAAQVLAVTNAMNAL